MKSAWHVTHRSIAPDILAEGLAPGWGDDGYGVYLFDDLGAAEAYLAAGGWDRTANPDELVIMEIECRAQDLLPISVDLGWKNPEDYEHVIVHYMDDGAPNWRPDRITLLPAGSPDFEAGPF